MLARTRSSLHAADLITLIYAGVIGLVVIAFASRIPNWWLIVSVNAVAAAGIVALAVAHRRFGGAMLRIVHDWYLPLVVFAAFKELRFVISPLHGGADYDTWLIAADRWLFGTDPTRWLGRFAHPFLTEVLQIAYMSFYLLFLLAGVEAYNRADRRGFRRILFTCVYGFYLSFIGYLWLPAVGPRFTLHDYATIRSEPPGLWLTPYLRRFVDAGDSIPLDAPIEAARAVAQRDLFPSGHTMMSLVLIWCCVQLRLASRYVIAPVGALIIVATVVLRYHYVVDVMGGAALVVVCVMTARPVQRFLADRSEEVA